MLPKVSFLCQRQFMNIWLLNWVATHSILCAVSFFLVESQEDLSLLWIPHPRTFSLRKSNSKQSTRVSSNFTCSAISSIRVVNVEGTESSCFFKCHFLERKYVTRNSSTERTLCIFYNSTSHKIMRNKIYIMNSLLEWSERQEERALPVVESNKIIMY